MLAMSCDLADGLSWVEQPTATSSKAPNKVRVKVMNGF
jgi:hypothetical protein